MRATLLPVFFPGITEEECVELKNQIKSLSEIYADEAIFLSEICIDGQKPQADALVFPVLNSKAYQYDEIFKGIDVPVLILTSPYGTMEMWDWELSTYLRDLGCEIYTPYQITLAKTLIRALAVKRELKEGAKFLVFKDEPEKGLRPDIFSRFYWYEEKCVENIQTTLGCQFFYKSWKQVCDIARQIDDAEARSTCKNWDIPRAGISEGQYLKAVKLYMAISATIDEVGGVVGVGANCMNEAHLCDTSPCLAWNMLFEQKEIIWACEGDVVSLLSTYLVYKSTRQPVMMTNIYPFLFGMSALAHEKIDKFPEVTDPDNYALAAHCGYFGLAPQSFCSEWVFRPKVLPVASHDAIVIDCRFPLGKVTLTKIFPSLDKINIIDAEIEDYIQYPNSHCLNGALIHYNDGHKIMESLSSHHTLIVSGDVKNDLRQFARVFNLKINLI